MREYNDYAENLPEIVGKKSVFFFENDPLQEIYAHFFKFCLRDLREQILWKKWDVVKCRVFFRNDSAVNAMACKRGDLTWIEVNSGLFSKLFSTFYEHRFYLERIAEYGILKKVFPKDELYYLMFTTSTIFLYYHELGHIIQYDRSSNNFETREKSVSSIFTAFDIMKHVCEYDSDEFAANFLYERIKRKFHELRESVKSKQILLALITSSTAAIFILFEMLGGLLKLPIYYKRGSHPHPIVRILIINTVILKKMAIDFEAKYVVSRQEVVDRSFEILADLFASGLSLGNFSHAVNSESENLAAYLRELKDLRNQYSWMSVVKLRAATSDSPNQ